jgi:hypothetical protein
VLKQRLRGVRGADTTARTPGTRGALGTRRAVILPDPVARAHFLNDEGDLDSAVLRLAMPEKKTQRGLSGELEAAFPEKPVRGEPSPTTYRGMRINGQRVATWSSKGGWSGDSRPEAEWLQ